MLRDRLIFLVSVLQPYSQGGMINALALPSIDRLSFIVDSVDCWGYLILFVTHTFVSQRQSCSRKKAFAFSIPLSICYSNVYSKYYLTFLLFDSSFKNCLQTLYAWLRWLTFAFLVLPSLLAPVFDNTYGKILSLFLLALL